MLSLRPFAGELPSVNGEDFKAFDGTQNAPSILRFWNKQYEGIERANIFIKGIQSSPVFNKNDKDLTQQLGEAKVLRAMFYHDLVVMFGDVPFNTEPTMDLNSSFVIPVTDRNQILSFLIDDLKEAASGMKYAKELPLRCRKGFKGILLWHDCTNCLNTGRLLFIS